MLRLADDGATTSEIAARFRRSPEYIERVIGLASLPGRAAPPHHARLRPVERRVLGWIEQGAAYDEIATRFGRGPGFAQRVESFAHYKLAAR